MYIARFAAGIRAQESGNIKPDSWQARAMLEDPRHDYHVCKSDIVSCNRSCYQALILDFLDDNALKKLRDTEADELNTGFIRFIINKKHCAV